MKIARNGWVSGLRKISSPNCDARPGGVVIDLLVIHNISLPPDEFGGKAITEFFTNTLDTTAHPYYEQIKGVKVSAHFLIRRDGQIIQFVPCTKRAWHAGVSAWHGGNALPAMIFHWEWRWKGATVRHLVISNMLRWCD